MGVVRGKDLVCSVYQPLEKKVTYLCVVRLLLDSTTALEGLFGEYHSSSAALGKRRLGVTKQPCTFR